MAFFFGEDLEAVAFLLEDLVGGGVGSGIGDRAGLGLLTSMASTCAGDDRAGLCLGEVGGGDGGGGLRLGEVAACVGGGLCLGEGGGGGGGGLRGGNTMPLFFH